MRFLAKLDTSMAPIAHFVHEGMEKVALALVLEWVLKEQAYSQVPLRCIVGLEVLACGNNIWKEES